MLLYTLFENPILFILVALALVFCLTIHEFSHAYVALKLGDFTAKSLGRVTLNPLAHLDILGTLMLLFVGFGWGKPVPYNPYNLKNPKKDGAIIAMAGPASNFLLALLISVILNTINPGGVFGAFLSLTIVYNLVLGIFNLIPIYPLDGFKIVDGFLPIHLSIQWNQMAPYGIVIMLFLVITDSFSRIINPILNVLAPLLGVDISM